MFLVTNKVICSNIITNKPSLKQTTENIADQIHREKLHSKLDVNLSARLAQLGAAAICCGITGFVNEELFRKIDIEIICCVKISPEYHL